MDTEDGERKFFSCEREIEELAERAWRERLRTPYSSSTTSHIGPNTSSSASRQPRSGVHPKAASRADSQRRLSVGLKIEYKRTKLLLIFICDTGSEKRRADEEDLVVNCMPSIDTFMWLMQYGPSTGDNIQRVAFATIDN